MSEYCPDTWVILKITQPEQPPLYKVLAGWGGSYLYGESWKINSGITKIEQDDVAFRYHGYSGSIYIGRKSGYGLGKATYPVWAQIVASGVPGDGIAVEMLSQDQAFALTLE